MTNEYIYEVLKYFVVYVVWFVFWYFYFSDKNRSFKERFIWTFKWYNIIFGLELIGMYLYYNWGVVLSGMLRL